MRRNQKRIWDCFDFSDHNSHRYSAFSDRSSHDGHVLSNREIRQLIEGYSEWINKCLKRKWRGYLVTVRFHPLRGGHRAKVAQMHRDLMKMYGRLVTRYVRDPRSADSEHLLPTGFFIPDYPVPKREKGDVHEVYINDGLHMHGVICANRRCRVREHLNMHISDNIRTYLVGKIQHIDVQPIVLELQAVVGYAMKALYRRKVSIDDILIVPRSRSELPAR